MGNVASFIKSHGKRFKNRYNAQYRALKFLERDNLAKAPRHKISHEYQNILDSSTSHDFQRKDLELDKYLKNVYVLSKDTIPENTSGSNFRNPSRTLPESRQPVEDLLYIEPNDINKGFCTLTQISKFLADHEEDPENNDPATIAKNHNLDIDKVENILKYHCIFKFKDYELSSDAVEDRDDYKKIGKIYEDSENLSKAVQEYYKRAMSKRKEIDEKSKQLKTEEEEEEEGKDNEQKIKAMSGKKL